MQKVARGARGEGGGWGVLEGEKVRGVCALGAVREGRAPQLCRSGGTYAGRRWVVEWACGGEPLGRRAGDRAPGREGGPLRRGRRRAGGGNGRRGRLPRLGSGGRERWRRGECPAGRVGCACGRWGTWRRGLLGLTWGPRVLCGRGA